MAKIEFDNSYDLINYLCKEDILGELQVSFTQKRSTMLEASYNFDYPELEEHLDMIFLDWPSVYGATTSAIYIVFSNAEDYVVKAEDNMQWSEYNLSKDIYEYVQDQIFQEYGVEYSLLIRMEGTGFTLEKTDTSILSVDKFILQISGRIDDYYYCEEGIPDAFDYYDLEDGKSFILDTELLKTS